MKPKLLYYIYSTSNRNLHNPISNISEMYNNMLRTFMLFTTVALASVSVLLLPAQATPTSEPVKGGYWLSWTAEQNPPSTIPTQYFTHLFYSQLAINPSTYQLIITSQDLKLMPIFTTTLHSKTPAAKAMLSIGGGSTNYTTFSEMVSKNETRLAFIKSSIDTARKFGFDGLDLDWEFPNTTQDMSNLASLLQEWRQVIELEAKVHDRTALNLSAVVYYAADIGIPSSSPFYPGGAITSSVDFVNQRSFDYHGSWESVTGEPAIVFDKTSRFTTSYGVDSWGFHGVFGDKMVLGLPLYGRTWKLKDPKQTGSGAPAAGVGPGDNGIMLYKDIEDYNLAHNAKVVYNESSIGMYSYSGLDWIGYDGPSSITAKVAFAKGGSYKGYFLWAIGYDKNWELTTLGMFLFRCFFFCSGSLTKFSCLSI